MQQQTHFQRLKLGTSATLIVTLHLCLALYPCPPLPFAAAGALPPSASSNFNLNYVTGAERQLEWVGSIGTGTSEPGVDSVHLMLHR